MTPTHAYIPCQTPRHPSGAFDAVRSSVRQGMSPQDLAASPAMQVGLRYLAEGFYWEAHEVLEPVWMACPPNSRERAIAQALIQIANARLKTVMGRKAAAIRILALAKEHLRAASRGEGPVLGLTTQLVQALIDESRISL